MTHASCSSLGNLKSMPASSVTSKAPARKATARAAARTKKTTAVPKQAYSPFEGYSYKQLVALLQFADRFNAKELTHLEVALARAADKLGYVRY
jgi:hypothetical protein